MKHPKTVPMDTIQQLGSPLAYLVQQAINVPTKTNNLSNALG